MADPSKVKRGRQAEEQAAQYLLGLGYTIITRNFTIRGGEIDLIALDADDLVFVEVRLRSDDAGEESIGPHKSATLMRTAQRYLSDMDETRDYRFDLIVIGPSELRHHINFLEN